MPFLISSENSKRALNIYRVFRKLSYVNQPGFLGRGSLKNPGFFVLKKGAGCQPPIPDRSPVSRRTAFFRFLTQLFRAWKRAPEEMEVKSEESKPSKSQVKQNQTGIPFPHRASRTDWEACVYSIPTVWGMPLSRTWFSVPGWGRRMYAHAIDEAIWKGGTQMNMPFLSRGQVEFTRSCYPPGTRIVLNSMNDPYAPVESGIRGTVRYVDDAGQVGVAWDNGRSLSCSVLS